MASRQGDPRECLKFIGPFLGPNGGLQSPEWIPVFVRLMEVCDETASRCTYLNILERTKSDILSRFIKTGGYMLLNSWLVCATSTDDTALLRGILLALKKLPLRVEHLKMVLSSPDSTGLQRAARLYHLTPDVFLFQNDTARLVWQLSKRTEIGEVRRLASSLVKGWLAEIVSHCQLSSGSAADKSSN